MNGGTIELSAGRGKRVTLAVPTKSTNEQREE
jgi:hypothetical protein